MKPMVVYYSVTSEVENVAKKIAADIGAETLRIEKNAGWTGDALGDHDLIFLGFPLVMFREPEVVDNFLKSVDFSGRTVVPFTVTSLGTGSVTERLRDLAPHAVFRDEHKFSSASTDKEIAEWARRIASA
ncbi:MAG: flavodoxin [Methanomethylophilus sp.]|jgi:flavodoxin